jgi:hypothetical protein
MFSLAADSFANASSASTGPCKRRKYRIMEKFGVGQKENTKTQYFN